MSCLPCFGGGEKKKKKEGPISSMKSSKKGCTSQKDNHKMKNSSSSAKDANNGNIESQTFTFLELAAATKNFTPDCLLGEGGFGRVYKGCLESNGQTVAIKQLDRNGLQGNKEFSVEVLMLSLLHHPNLVNLIGYCADGDQRLLVYEYMPKGSVEDHLLDLSPEQKPMEWYTRMKIAYGAAQGIEYLHDKANPPVIYRDLKSSNILLDDLFTPKLSDFGLAKLGPMGEKNHVSSRVMGTYGYCAPEYARTGHLTPKSDVYSFGVVLLELITGRRAIDTMKPTTDQNLVTWAQPMFKEQKRFPELVDPLLRDNYPAKGLNQAVAVAAMCLQDEASVRPLMADVVVALSFLVDAPPPAPQAAPAAPAPEARRSSSGSSEDGRRVVETLQLGKKPRRRKGSSSRRGSRSSSRHGSSSSRCESDGSSRYSAGGSSSPSGGGGHGSSSSKHSSSSSSPSSRGSSGSSKSRNASFSSRREHGMM